MASHVGVNTGSDNGLLPDGNKPLPEPMLPHDRMLSVAFSRDQLFIGQIGNL